MERFGYDVWFLSVGPQNEAVGAPVQMAVFYSDRGVEWTKE